MIVQSSRANTLSAAFLDSLDTSSQTTSCISGILADEGPYGTIYNGFVGPLGPTELGAPKPDRLGRVLRGSVLLRYPLRSNFTGSLSKKSPLATRGIIHPQNRFSYTTSASADAVSCRLLVAAADDLALRGCVDRLGDAHARRSYVVNESRLMLRRIGPAPGEIKLVRRLCKSMMLDPGYYLPTELGNMKFFGGIMREEVDKIKRHPLTNHV